MTDRDQAIAEALHGLGPVPRVGSVPLTSLTQVRAITLLRPWPSLMLFPDPVRRKPIENRGQRMHHRGPLVLHAGQGVDDRAWPVMARMGIDADEIEGYGPTGYRGVVNVVGCCDLQLGPASSFGWPECGCGGWAFGGSAHIACADARAFPEPIRGRGQQGTWTPPQDVLDTVWGVG